MDRQKDAEKKRDRRTGRRRIRQQREKSLVKLIIIFHNFANLPTVMLYSVTLCGDRRTIAVHG